MLSEAEIVEGEDRRSGIPNRKGRSRRAFRLVFRGIWQDLARSGPPPDDRKGLSWAGARIPAQDLCFYFDIARVNVNYQNSHFVA